MTKSLPQWILIIYFSALVSSEGPTKELRVVHKLIGGHVTLNRDDDVELITSGAGEGKTSGKKKSEQEEKKTLAQQVADGKYGLIQSELFSKPIKKPGLISYRENSEVPSDTVNNLGGLNKSDIWLSENHLLIIKGGSYPPHSSQSVETNVWPSIDDFNAPRRQVKIPAHPRVPPPFPVQLTDNGPLLFLGTNASKTLNGTFQSPVHPLYSEENYVSDGGSPSYPNRNSANPSSGQTPFPISPFPPPGLDYYDAAKEGPLNATFPYFPFVGPGDLPPLDNVTYDEDDPSIYYPPPYSFYYQQDNSTEVPPGPLVPGIVLPPPPYFFAPLIEEAKKNDTKKINVNKSISHILTSTYKPITSHNPTIYKLTTTPRPTTSAEVTTVKSSTQISGETPTLIQNYSFPTLTPTNEKPSIVSNSRKKYPNITILKAITTTIPHINKQTGSPFKFYGPPSTPTRTKTIVTTTRVPLKSYYTSTHMEPFPPNKPNKQFIEEVLLNIPKPTASKPAAQYYLYDENIINTTPKLGKSQEKYNIGEYYVPAKEVDVLFKQPPREQNLRYYYINDNPKPEYSIKSQRPDTFSIHIARLREQINSYETAFQNNNDYYRRPTYQTMSKPVYQYSFEAADYKNQRNQYPQSEYSDVKHPFSQYNVEIQEAVEVTAPTPVYETTREDTYYYSEAVTENPKNNKHQKNRSRSKPISEYSFEATPNPIFQQLYTKYDEPYIDDVTKEYFTVFGKKLPMATTPIPTYSRSEYLKSSPENQIRSKPVSLLRDTLVNYQHPRPQINPHAEFLENIKYPSERNENQGYANYQNTAEKLEERGPFISYKLPGDEGTHFYFITPKLVQKRDKNGKSTIRV